MDALRDLLWKVSVALIALFCAAFALLATITGFAVWGDYRTQRTTRELLHDPTHDPKSP